jgi:hypothetical protein
MAFLSGLLGALGGPGNIIKSIGSFVSDSLGGLSRGEGFSGIAKAGSNAIRGLIGQSPGPDSPEHALEDNNKKPDRNEINRELVENIDRQASNMRPVFQTNTQATKQHQILDTNAADYRPIFSTSQNQPNVRMSTRSIYRPPVSSKEYNEVRVNSGGFPNKTLLIPKKFTTPNIRDLVEPGTKLSKGQKRRLKKKFRNYMEE